MGSFENESDSSWEREGEFRRRVKGKLSYDVLSDNAVNVEEVEPVEVSELWGNACNE